MTRNPGRLLPDQDGSGPSLVRRWMPHADQSPWVRPADWPTLPTLATTDNRLVGLVAVFPDGANAVALSVTVTGGFTVDWGDGSGTTNHASAATAQHAYTYATLGTAVTAGGYKTAIVSVTPQSANAFTVVNLQLRPSTTYTYAQSSESGWLDIAVAGPSIATLRIGSSDNTYGNGAQNMTMGLLQQATLVKTAVTDATNLFWTCPSLASVGLTNDSFGPLTKTPYMFYACPSLATVPLFNTASVTDMSHMFDAARSLVTVPLFNTGAATTMAYMFGTCTALTAVPLFNMASVTDATNMFASCASLVDVPPFNTASLQIAQRMFSGCSSLPSVPLLNTASVTDLSYMFNLCYKLTSVPAFNTAAATTTASMFNGCTKLTTVPSFNTEAVTTSASMFAGCTALTTLPALNLRRCTTLTGWSSLYSLGAAPILFKGTVDISNNRMSAADLNNLYTALPGLGSWTVDSVATSGGSATFHTTATHTMVVGQTVVISGVTPAGYNGTFKVTRIDDTSHFTVVNATTGAITVSGSANGGSASTLTITNALGSAASTKSIATLKGWTVSG